MTAPAANVSGGDDCTSVSLSALLGLRAQVRRTALVPQTSPALRSGQQRSRLYGRGMDYAESRAYQPGDDARRLDWRLTARSGRLHTKLFQEDREGSLLILLDTCASLRFGTRARFKSVQAARAAAAAAWRAVAAGERVGLASFGASRYILPPRAGVRAALAVCGALAQWDAASPTAVTEPLSAAVLRLRAGLARASRVLIVTDGFSCGADAAPGLAAVARARGLCLLVVSDPLESALPAPGTYPLQWSGRPQMTVLQSDRQRHAFHAAMGAGQRQARELATTLGCRVLSLDTRADAVAVTAAAFARKGTVA